MPNRILKESILDSPTLARLDDFSQDQFPRLLLLVDDWGCFNADPEAIKGRAYPKRPKVSVKVIERTLRAFHENGMLFRWQEGDRQYGYWVGWDNHNYCNSSQVDEDGKQVKHRRKTPVPDPDLLAQYITAFQDKLGQAGTKSSIPIPIPIPSKKNIGKENEKKPHGEHGNVLLTDMELEKLQIKFGETDAKERINAADFYFGSKGNAGQYASHYLTILNWDRMKTQAAKARASPGSADMRSAAERQFEKQQQLEAQWAKEATE